MDRKLTIRLNKAVYNQLKYKAEYLGVTLSSLLKYQLYELRNKNFPILHFNVNDTVRMTLSLPYSFYSDINNNSKNHNISKNDFINSALHHYLNS